jgi:hypothetical protein
MESFQERGKYANWDRKLVSVEEEAIQREWGGKDER